MIDNKPNKEIYVEAECLLQNGQTLKQTMPLSVAVSLDQPEGSVKVSISATLLGDIYKKVGVLI